MNSKIKSPFLNLGAITRETGLNADTLRAWERRYKLPQPTRSEGGQRLYSQKDLETVKWLIAQQKAGLRISQAVDLWRSQIEEGVDPLLNVTQFESPLDKDVDRSSLATYRRRWFLACVAFNESKAEQIVTEAFSQYPPENVCFDVLLAGLSEIGNSWYQGEVSVQQEHFASALVMRRLNTLIAGAAPPIRSEKIIVAEPSNEDHTISSLLLTYLLRRRGWDVVYLGADVPLDNFKTTLETIQPELVILTAQQIFTAASLLDFARELNELPVDLAYGGLIFNRVPLIQEAISGYFLGEDLKNAVPSIEKLIFSATQKEIFSEPITLPIQENFHKALPLIEERVSEAIRPYPALHTSTTTFLSRDILASLKLGDITFLNADIDWLRGLLANVEIPGQVLQRFLDIYAQVLDEILGEEAALILDWLRKSIENISMEKE